MGMLQLEIISIYEIITVKVDRIAYMKKIDFVTLLKNYTSGWVGISADFNRVVLSGKTLQEVIEKAKEIKEKLYYFPAEESYGNFVGADQYLPL
jgi:predicted RNase H-like HicB family nuclease